MKKEINETKIRELCKASLEIEALFKIFHHLLLTNNDDSHIQLPYLSEVILKRIIQVKKEIFTL